MPTGVTEQFQNEIIKDIEALSQLQQLIAGPNAQSVDIVHVLSGQAGREKYISQLKASMQNGELAGLKDVPEKDRASVLAKIMQIAMSVGVTLALPGAYVRYKEEDIDRAQ